MNFQQPRIRPVQLDATACVRSHVVHERIRDSLNGLTRVNPILDSFNGPRPCSFRPFSVPDV